MPKPKTRKPDVSVRDEGTIVLLAPLTVRAKEWFLEHVEQGGQRWCGAYVVEHRFAGNIISGLEAEGFDLTAPGGLERVAEKGPAATYQSRLAGLEEGSADYDEEGVA